MPSGTAHYSKVTAKGQVTLPAELRDGLGVKPGDVVEIRAGKGADGAVVEVRRRTSAIEATAGIARPKGAHQAREWHEIEEIAKEEVAGRLYEEMNE
ncbi:MAG: AbrB/MazE/SpoVT family DNA-binding domain-containing protein [Dehalococcoidia bacterium]|nr:AbrB/MazE/SpoVT family DNA-binding domain-containing protein [Dehalococcoidia bacterium]